MQIHNLVNDRITSLYWDALSEDEYILPAALSQFAEFFLARPELARPAFSITPDRTIRVMWIRDRRNFVAVEFTGDPLVNMIVGKSQDGSFPAFNFSREALGAVEGEVERMLGNG